MTKKLPVGRPRVKDADRKRGSQITLYLDYELLARLDAAVDAGNTETHTTYRADYIRTALIYMLDNANTLFFDGIPTNDRK